MKNSMFSLVFQITIVISFLITMNKLFFKDTEGIETYPQTKNSVAQYAANNFGETSSSSSYAGGPSLESTFKTIMKQLGGSGEHVAFNTTRTQQAKQILSGALAQRNNNGGSSSYDADLSIYTSTSETWEFCSNGQFTYQSSSRISGGGYTDSGNSGFSGEWDVADYQGNLSLVVYCPNEPEIVQLGAKGLNSVYIVDMGMDYISFDFGDGENLNFRLNPQSASCR